MSSDRRKRLRETSAGSLGDRIFMASLGAWIVDRPIDVRLRGTKGQIVALSEALLASKRLHEELNRNEATVETVMNKLRLKQAAASNFESEFGVPWPL